MIHTSALQLKHMLWTASTGKYFKLPKQLPINVFSQEVLGPGHQCQKPLESNTTIVNKPAVHNHNHDSTSAQVLIFKLHAFLELEPHHANL